MSYNYIPKYIRQSENKSPKSVVTASRWNELFNLLIQQGDHTAEELGNILNYFSTRLVDVESEISESAEAIANIREVFRINVTYSNGVYSADKTFAEIKAAYEAGQQPYVVYDGNTIYTLSYCYFASEQMFADFERYLIGEDTLKTEALRIYSYTTASGSNIVKRTSSFDAPSGGGTSDHSQLTNRDAANQHPITAITGLQTALDGKADATDIPSLEDYATEAYVQNHHDNTKQDIITDLATIRSGASKGATAVQPEAGKGLFSGSYNDLTDKPAIPDAVTEGTISGWGFTKNTGTYSKPAGGIPKADLANDVQISLGKADTALQEHQSLAAYRTALEQNRIDNGKVNKVTGKGLSTNDYTDAAKAKVDALALVATSGSYNDLTDKPIQLTGTTAELTPTQVYNAVSAGVPVKVQRTDGTYGLLSFTAFNIAESLSMVVSQAIVYYNSVYILAELGGNIQTGDWFTKFTTLAEKKDIPDIPTLLPNPHAITFTGAVTGNYDGSAPMTINIPSAVTDAHINSLIDTKLGVIENGSY